MIEIFPAIGLFVLALNNLRRGGVASGWLNKGPFIVGAWASLIIGVEAVLAIGFIALGIAPLFHIFIAWNIEQIYWITAIIVVVLLPILGRRFGETKQQLP